MDDTTAKRKRAELERLEAQHKADRNTVLIFVGLFVAAALVLLAIWVGISYFEAKAYNRVTGRDVSVWDAMWIELRVTG